LARHIQQGYVQDKRGDVIYDATVTIYLAGTTTAVTAYAAVSGGSSVGYVETDSKGYYKYFIDDTEYASDQRFKHVISKTGYTDITEDYLEILPGRLALPVYTLTNDATPSVAGGNIFLTGGTTTITDFDDGVTGQIIYILAEHSVTITDGTNILLADSANYEMVDGNILTLICKADNKWYELSRSDSGA